MPQNPGNQTITFNPPGNFVVDQYHTVPASSGLTSAGVGQEWQIVGGASRPMRVLGIELIPEGWGRNLFCTFVCKEEQG